MATKMADNKSKLKIAQFSGAWCLLQVSILNHWSKVVIVGI